MYLGRGFRGSEARDGSAASLYLLNLWQILWNHFMKHLSNESTAWSTNLITISHGWTHFHLINISITVLPISLDSPSTGPIKMTQSPVEKVIRMYVLHTEQDHLWSVEGSYGRGRYCWNRKREQQSHMVVRRICLHIRQHTLVFYLLSIWWFLIHFQSIYLFIRFV